LSKVVGAFKLPELKKTEYSAIRDFIYKEAGIDLGESKQVLVSSRLNKRLRFHKLTSFKSYIELIFKQGYEQERQMAIDLLTTNETYFFREPEHFAFLKKQVLPHHEKSSSFRVWSAASSSGEEAYTLAMILDDYFGQKIPWKVFGSDVSNTILEKAIKGLYPIMRIDGIPKPFLKKYCLKGKDEFDGFLRVNESIRNKCSFKKINLIKALPNVGKFDVIFLRNVLIYFDDKTKQDIVRRLLDCLKKGGHLFIGHSESLKGMNLGLKLLAPTTYVKL